MLAWRSVLSALLLSVFLPFLTYNAGSVPNPEPIPSEVVLVPITSNLTDITDVTHAADARLFVAEQVGRIRIIRAGQLLAAPFLDIRARVACCVERGLLGLAFHPGYGSNGYFYVNYTYNSASGLRTRVSRFKVSQADPNAADPDSEVIVLEFAQPYLNHNGGALQFGPEGYLYVATGDGGDAYDPPDNGQNTGNLLGKVLRIDVDAATGSAAECSLAPGGNYRIPPGNPLADGAGAACDEIWSYGLRNPWRISFDRRTWDLWIADVGQGAREEIDFQPASSAGGENYGWDCYEGNLTNTQDPSPACTGNHAGYTFPIHEYSHSAGRCSIIGGSVYRGPRRPGWEGLYFFADLCSGELWVLRREASGNSLVKLATPGATLIQPRTFGQDLNGELYVGTGSTLYRIDPVSAAAGGPAEPAVFDGVAETRNRR